jgi:long-chain fatty acid transport protein
MSIRLKAPLLAASTILSTVGFAGVAHADAFYLEAQSARGAGRAFSGEAADTGADSLWWNPAAIAGITSGDAEISATAILPHGDVVDHGTLIVRPAQAPAYVGGPTVSHNPIDNGVLPSGSVAYPINDRIAIGLAVTSPFSFTTDYGNNGATRYSAEKTRLRTVDMQPSIGVVVTDWLRIGGALNVEYTDAYLSNALPNVSPLQADGQQVLKGHGWDFGWTAGVQLHNSLVTLGVSYKSAITHTLTGDLNITGLQAPLAGNNLALSGVQAKFRTPAQVIVAGRLNATNKLTLDAQLVAYSWGKFDAITLGAPVNVAIPENYRDSFSVAGGFDYAVTPRATVRAGVQRTITPTQDGLRDARVPDSDRWTYAAGGAYQLTRHVRIDVSGSYVQFKDSLIDRITAAYAGTPVQTPILTNATLENAHAIVLSVGGHLTF